MTFATAKRLVSVDLSSLSLEELQRHRVRLIDAWRESKASYGMGQAVKNGFYIRVLCHQADGYAPKDIFLTSNLDFLIDRCYELEKQYLERS